MTKVRDIIKRIEKKFPIENSEPWDNVGLIVGNDMNEAQKIQLSLDITSDVIRNAIENKVDLIITHHPMIFKGIKKINNKNKLGEYILELIRNDISVYSMHTNLDSSKEGLNNYIVEKLGVEHSKLIESSKENFYKLNVFVPEKYFKEIREKIIETNVEVSDNYSKVSYSFLGEETFYSKENSNPYEGEINSLTITNSYKIEVLTRKSVVQKIVQEVKKIHPYQEIAYETIKLENKMDKDVGIGRVYNLETPVSISEYSKTVKEKLGLEFLRAGYNEDKKIKKIGIINGSGFSFVDKMRRKNVDLFITSDIKYHEGLECVENGLAFLDIGHYESELFFSELVLKELPKELEVEIYNHKPLFKVIPESV